MTDFEVTTEGVTQLIMKLKRLGDVVGNPEKSLEMAAVLQDATAVFGFGGGSDSVASNGLPANGARSRGSRSAPQFMDKGVFRQATSLGAAHALFSNDPLMEGLASAESDIVSSWDDYFAAQAATV